MAGVSVMALAVVLIGTGAGAVIDLRTRRVPDSVTLPLAAAGLVLAAAGLGRVGMMAACAGLATGLLLMLPGYLFGGTGGGDVKLLAAAGSLLGPHDTLWAFAFTLIAGAVLALSVAVVRGRFALTMRRTAGLAAGRGGGHEDIRRPDAGNRFAYAPAIAAGVMAALVRP